MLRWKGTLYLFVNEREIWTPSPSPPGTMHSGNLPVRKNAKHKYRCEATHPDVRLYIKK